VGAFLICFCQLIAAIILEQLRIIFESWKKDEKKGYQKVFLSLTLCFFFSTFLDIIMLCFTK